MFLLLFICLFAPLAGEYQGRIVQGVEFLHKFLYNPNDQLNIFSVAREVHEVMGSKELGQSPRSRRM
jgi:hypothetical protein